VSDQTRVDDLPDVVAAQGGDAHAFRALFERWYDPVFDVAVRILRDRDAAAGVARDVFANARRLLGSLKDPAEFGAWILRNARNRAIDQLERSGTADGGGEAAPDRLEDSDDSVLLWAATAVFGAHDASVVDLHERHGLQAVQLADELGVPAADAHLRLFHLRARLGSVVRGFVLWNDGTPTCVDLTNALDAAKVTTFGPVAVRIISRHALGCEACTTRQHLRPSPEARFRAVPMAAPGPVVKARAANALGIEPAPLRSPVPPAPKPPPQPAPPTPPAARPAQPTPPPRPERPKHVARHPAPRVDHAVRAAPAPVVRPPQPTPPPVVPPTQPTPPAVAPTPAVIRRVRDAPAPAEQPVAPTPAPGPVARRVEAARVAPPVSPITPAPPTVVRAPAPAAPVVRRPRPAQPPVKPPTRVTTPPAPRPPEPRIDERVHDDRRDPRWLPWAIGVLVVALVAVLLALFNVIVEPFGSASDGVTTSATDAAATATTTTLGAATPTSAIDTTLPPLSQPAKVPATAGPAILTFEARAGTVKCSSSGRRPVVLSWKSVNGTSAQLLGDGAPPGSLARTGSATLCAPTAPSTYSLTVTSATGTTTQTIDVP
jgi:DNA-directed RNA polymerase specialized sigma24 family protein